VPIVKRKTSATLYQTRGILALCCIHYTCQGVRATHLYFRFWTIKLLKLVLNWDIEAALEVLHVNVKVHYRVIAPMHQCT